MLVNQHGLAKTSQRPGKTQLINHFLINEKWYIVDLPGYGYAKVSKSSRENWEKFIRNYITKRESLQCVFVLIDSRLEPQKIDLEFCCWMGEIQVPFALLFTKADKQSSAKTDKNVAAFKKALKGWFEEIPPYMVTSAEKGQGRDEVLQFIEQVNQDFVMPVFTPKEGL
jgi:GTP-binding protein